jgi:thiamine-phosphate diphosphorylase
LTRSIPRLFLVTDSEVVEDPAFLERARTVLAAAGPDCAIQLRTQTLPSSALWEIACELKQIASEKGSSFWVNDRIDVATVVRADGVQLGSRSMTPEAARRTLGGACLIGRSVHSADEALSVNADVVVLGSIYPTKSHPGRQPLGLEELRRAAAGRRPIVAIGGITPQRVGEVINQGAWGVAVLSGVWGADEPATSAREYASALAGVVPGATMGRGHTRE